MSRVLVVEDEVAIAELISLNLRHAGFEVVLAQTGDMAQIEIDRVLPDLVLLDWMLPGQSGLTLAKRWRTTPRTRDLPIIMLTARAEEVDKVAGLDAGADDYLTKPINFVVLEAKLRSMQRSLALQQDSIDSLRRVQAISDSVLDAIVTCDEHGIVVSVNQSAERIFGWTPSEIIGQNVSMLMPTDQRPAHESRLSGYGDDIPQKTIGLERELEAQHKDGHRFAATLTITNVQLDNQRMIVGVLRDVSERKRTEHQLRDNARQLQDYFDQTQAEQQLALRLMEKQLHRKGLLDSRLRYAVIPAENFSGDIVAANRSVDGHFYALLADATGHGLTAAISVLPVLALFYRMTKLNRPIREIVLELNFQLKESMPVGRFVAITLVCLDEAKKQGDIWVGGTPQAFLFDRWGRACKTFPSANLPLGIVSNDELGGEPQHFSWENESQLILCSDGLLEATNPQGIQFGVDGLIAATANTSPSDRFEKIETALATHQDSAVASDDISIMLIDCP